MSLIKDKKNFILVVLICSLSDSLLIVCGIYLSNFLSLNPSVITIMKLVGGIWLILYGINKIKNKEII